MSQTRITLGWPQGAGAEQTRTHTDPAARWPVGALTRLLLLPLVLLGIVASGSPAAAGAAYHSGTICKNYNAGEAQYIDYYDKGVRSMKAALTQQIICPVVGNGHGTVAKGAVVRVDLWHNSFQTTSCILSAAVYPLDAGQRISLTRSAAFQGYHELEFVFVGTTNTNTPYSDYNVLCTIPGYGAGLVLGIDFFD